MKQIIIDIKPDGSVKIEAVGFQGQSCLEATKPFEEALGKVEAREEKPEYFIEGQEFHYEDN